MSRPRGGYFPVFAASILNHRKFRRLTKAQKGCWLDIRSHFELLGPLAPDDIEALDCDPADVERLVEVGLFDLTRDGLVVHDVDEHRAYPSDSASATAERKRRSRAGGSSEGPAEVPVFDPEAVADVTNGHEGHELSRVGRDSRARIGVVWSGDGVQDYPRAPAREGDDAETDLWVRLTLLGSELVGTPLPFGSQWGRMGETVMDMGHRVPWEQLERTWREVAAVYGRPTSRQLVFDAGSRLFPTGLAARGAVTGKERETAEAEALIQQARDRRAPH